jgi:hypothetical protein
MTEEMSELDTDCEDKRIENKKKVVTAAGLSLKEIEGGLPVWEIVKPGHRSTEVCVCKVV